MKKAKVEWVGVAEVAAEMGYTHREAWEYIRAIAVVVTNPVNMKLARFKLSDFEKAREKSRARIKPRAKTGPKPKRNRRPEVKGIRDDRAAAWASNKGSA